MVSRVRRPLRRGSRAGAGISIVVAGLVLSTAPSAHADTARLQVAKREGAIHPTRIVVTTATGVRRTLGPYPLRSRSSDLLASPDGRFLVVVPEFSVRPADLTVVSLDGGAPVVVRAPRGITILPPLPMLSWALDSSELVVDHAFVGDDDADRVQWAVLRCAAPTFACQRADDGSGTAAAVPGGIVTGSTLLSAFPSGRALNLLTSLNQSDGGGFSRGSASARELRRLVTSPVASRITTIVDGRPPTVSTVRRSLRHGLPVTSTIVGGASGALLTQEVYRAAVRSRRNSVGGTLRVTQLRLVRVTADGAAHTSAVPRLTIPRADAVPNPSTGRSRAKRAPVVPRIGLPTGGWLATAGIQPSTDDALTLARIDADGAARFVRSRGRIVSATSLEAQVRGAAAEPGLASLTVVGYEQATDAAIVVLRWWESGRRQPAAATFRVPLDEQTPPTIVSRLAAGAAW